MTATSVVGNTDETSTMRVFKTRKQLVIKATQKVGVTGEKIDKSWARPDRSGKCDNFLGNETPDTSLKHIWTFFIVQLLHFTKSSYVLLICQENCLFDLHNK
jgi:hypothetical protein